MGACGARDVLQMFRHARSWKSDRPMSRPAFEARFPDELACARYLVERRWADGFVCPLCGSCKSWELKRDRPARECADCGRQTSVTAGTTVHRSHLTLKTWFLAAHIVASHSNGISALQLQGQLGLGSYKTAWLLLHKLRRAMVDPDRSLLQDLVEIDETEMPFRSKHDTADKLRGGRRGGPKGGRSPVGKIFIVGAVELSADGHPRRIRMAHIPDGSSPTDLRKRCTVSSVGPSRPVRMSSATAGWAMRTRPPTPTKSASSRPRRRTISCLGFTASSRTSSDGRRASFTACTRPMSSATSTSSCSDGTEDVTRKALSTRSSGSASASGRQPIAISSISASEAARNLSQNATSCAPRPMPPLRTPESDTVQAAGQHKMW